MSHFIPEPRNILEVIRLSAYVKNAWLKATMKYIKNIINNLNFLMDDPEKGYPVTPCMDVFKSKIQYDGSLDKLKFRIVVRGDLQNKETIGDTSYPIASMINNKYFLEDTANNKERVHQLDFIGEFLQSNVKHGVF